MPGARSQFKVMKKNPNTGGGCICSPDSKVVDCKGPYVVGTHKEMFVSKNPYVVIGSGCLARANEKVNGKPEAPAAEQVEVRVVDLDQLSTGELAAALSNRLTAVDVGEPVEGK